MSASDPATAGAPDLRDFSGLLVLVGAGKMGSGLLDGWLRFGLKPENVIVYAGSSEPLHYTVLAYTSPAKSLVIADRSGDGLRYRLLETIRQYAADQMLQTTSALFR